MLLYSDVLTGDEMFSDAFPMSVFLNNFVPLLDVQVHRKDIDDIVYEVDCQMVTVKAGAADVDIGKSSLTLDLTVALTVSQAVTLPLRKLRKPLRMARFKSTTLSTLSDSNQPPLTRSLS
jgi:hypothetical protein